MRHIAIATVLLAACSDPGAPAGFDRFGHWSAEWSCSLVGGDGCVPPELFGAPDVTIGADGVITWTFATGTARHQSTDDGVCFDVPADTGAHSRTAYSMCPDEESGTMATAIIWDQERGPAACSCLVVLRR